MTSLPLRAGRRAVSKLGALMMTPAFLFTGITVTALVKNPASAFAQDAKTYTLVRTYKAKDVSKYKYNITTNVNSPQLGGAVDLVLNMALRETVKDVKENGSTVLLTEFDSASVKIGPGAQDMDISSFLPTITTTVDKSGKVVDVVMDGGNPMFTSGPGSGMFKSLQQQNFFPTKPIKVGETWKIELDSKDKAGVKTTGTATFLSVESLSGIQTAKVKMVTDSETTTENPDTPNKLVTVKSHSEGVANYDIATGRVVKMTSTSTSDNATLGKTEIKVELVPNDKKADTKTEEKK